jgi:hypothetical protein
MHYRFHVNVFARTDRAVAGATLALRKVCVTPLRGPAGGPLFHEQTLGVSFDQALAALGRLPRLDAEPDGYFLFSGGRSAELWHVNGHLFDDGDALHRVELRGDCPAEAFDALLGCFGWPQATLAFELVREGVALDEADFRAYASAAAAC